jgi:hypothetical protein
LFRANVGVFLQTRNAPPGDTETNHGIFYQAMRVPPYVHPAIYADGRIPRVMHKENPWAWATQRGYEKLNHNKIESLVSLEQDLKFITPGLKFKGTFSFDKFSATSVTRSKNPYYYNPPHAMQRATSSLMCRPPDKSSWAMKKELNGAISPSIWKECSRTTAFSAKCTM